MDDESQKASTTMAGSDKAMAPASAAPPPERPVDKDEAAKFIVNSGANSAVSIADGQGNYVAAAPSELQADVYKQLAGEYSKAAADNIAAANNTTNASAKAADDATAFGQNAEAAAFNQAYSNYEATQTVPAPPKMPVASPPGIPASTANDPVNDPSGPLYSVGLHPVIASPGSGFPSGTLPTTTPDPVNDPSGPLYSVGLKPVMATGPSGFGATSGTDSTPAPSNDPTATSPASSTPTPSSGDTGSANSAPVVTGVTSAAAQASPASAASNAEATYVVKSGDTMWGIAQSHNTSLADLEAANRSNVPNPRLIFAGQTINLPEGGVSEDSATTGAPAGNGTYTVAHGDTLSAIAEKYHVSLASLEAANKGNIPNPNLIFPGETVHIPGAAPVTASGSTSTATTADPVTPPVATVTGTPPLGSGTTDSTATTPAPTTDSTPTSFGFGSTGGTVPSVADKTFTTDTPAPTPLGTPTAAKLPDTSVNSFVSPAQAGLAPGSNGDPAPGMAPGTKLVFSPNLPGNDGAGDKGTVDTVAAHADSTGGALVYSEKAAATESVAKEAAGWGETTNEFVGDNTEFKPDGTVNKGAYFEIRADKVFPNASTYNVNKL